MQTNSVSQFGAFRRLLHQLSPKRRRQLLATAAAMVVGAIAEVATIGALLPFLAVLTDPSRVLHSNYMSFIAPIVGSNIQNLALAATVIFAVTAMVAAVVRMAVTWISFSFVFSLGEDLSTAVYGKMLYKPYAYHIDKNTSEIIGAVNKVQALTHNLALPLILAFSAAIISSFIVAFLLLINPVVSLISFVGFGSIYAYFGFVMKDRLRSNSRVISRSYASRVQILQEGLGAIRDIILDRSQAVFLKRFTETEARYRKAQAVNVFVGAAPRFVIEAAGMVMIAAITCVLVLTGSNLAATLPVLGALILGAQRMLPMMQQIYYGSAQISANWSVLLDVLDLLETPSDRFEGDAPACIPVFRQHIRLDHLGFRYSPSAAPVLVDVNITIPKGSKVGVIGRTGCGKSTLMDIIMGLISPTSGLVWIDDLKLDEASCSGWRRQIAHVPQSIFLADDTIRNNIALGVEPDLIDGARVREVGALAQLTEFVDGLPAGYDTAVGERGVRLSGGQRQRIGIARALYKRAGVLVFDEATSALDERTESEVTASIARLGKDLTIFIISHRLSTIADCDLVLRLDAGRIVESGSYQDVVARLSNGALR